MNLVFLVLCCFWCTLSKLYQVVSLFRHGARYHLNSLYDGDSTLPLRGELSAVGMKQHENLGKLIRNEYVTKLKFLREIYNQTEIEVYSTTVNRTVQSVISQLYGLYPLGLGPNMPYTPRIYHLPPYSNKSDAQQQNFALPLGHQLIQIKFNPKVLLLSCPNWDIEIYKNIRLQIEDYKEMNITYFPFMKKMSAMYNISLESMNFSKLSSLFDTLTVDKFLGRPLPSDMLDSDYTNLQHLHEWFNAFKISQNLSKALNSVKFQKVLSEFDSRIRNPDTYPRRWTFLSAHDTDIAAAHVDLNISSAHCIEDLYRKGSTSAINCEQSTEYASSIIFELHSDNQKDFYVKIRNNGKYVNLCAVKNQTCPYNQWKNQIKKNLISNPTQICGNPSS